VFTSNLISQTTWLKVKLKLVNLYVGLLCGIAAKGCVSIQYAVQLLLLVVALVEYHHNILLQ